MDTYETIQQHLKSSGIYPSAAFVWEAGKPVYEFPFIEKLGDHEYKVHIQRHHPLDPFTLAERKFWAFDDLKEAIRKWNNLTNGIF